MSSFIILPNQLFDKQYLDQSYNYIIYEHPHYFKTYNYNKKKLILHHASMKYYYDYLKFHKFTVKYIHYDEKFNIKNYTIFDPIDKIKLTGKFTTIESPNFLLNKELYEKYRKKTKNFFFNSFYMWSKKELDIIPTIKSLDKENRNKIDKDIEIPKLSSLNKNDMDYIDMSIKYVNKHFKDNCGNTDDFIYPISHKTAKKWLLDFIKTKLNNFGNYQDAIDKDNDYLFHSLLSSSINIGLLNPTEIVEEILQYKNIKMNNLEGYIRQLFWREYQRYCYIYYDFDKDKNFFNNKTKLTAKWYNGTVGIEPVDDCIIKAFNSGYLHHIERLMVMGNYMNLSGISPIEGFKWFMEFSCDSYEWVMKQNVLHMVFFNGNTMRRPYVSSSNYILKMSNYKKGEWCHIWDEKYSEFLIKHKEKLWKFRYFFRGLK
jgi:deoxyribodipyrimidine photolyase-related protein